MIGLVVGSFLNVVIYRLPIMLERDWRRDARAILGQETEIAERFDLSFPNSHCPHCNTPIKAWHNIPVVSYLLLRGNCAACGASISPRYVAVELLTGLLSLVVALHFAPGVPAGAALILTWTLIALSFIDINHHLLPDTITLPLVWLGLILNISGTFAPCDQSIIGAVAGYLSLRMVYEGFKMLTGKEGMGFGDFKLLAMLGAWLGWQALPAIVLMSSLAGAVIGTVGILLAGRDKNLPIPFGPYLACGGWLAMLFGPQLNTWYLSLF